MTVWCLYEMDQRPEPSTVDDLRIVQVLLRRMIDEQTGTASYQTDDLSAYSGRQRRTSE